VKLIETEEMMKAARLNRFGGASAARVLMTVLRINRINRLYEEVSHHRGIHFIDALIEKLQLDYEVREEELKRIPSRGPFITVSNLQGKCPVTTRITTASVTGSGSIPP